MLHLIPGTDSKLHKLLGTPYGFMFYEKKQSTSFFFTREQAECLVIDGFRQGEISEDQMDPLFKEIDKLGCYEDWPSLRAAVKRYAGKQSLEAAPIMVHQYRPCNCAPVRHGHVHVLGIIPGDFDFHMTSFELAYMLTSDISGGDNEELDPLDAALLIKQYAESDLPDTRADAVEEGEKAAGSQGLSLDVLKLLDPLQYDQR